MIGLGKSDYILSVGEFFANDSLKSSLEKACRNGAEFIYLHPIDNFKLKDLYTQFIKYEVGSEEAILALVLNFFSKSKEDELESFLEELDLGYLSAESSAGEEEFEEAFLKFQEKTKQILLVGDDLIHHERYENIIKLLANIKKYTNFELIFLNQDLENDVNSCLDLKLEEIEDLKSFNGALVYFLNKDESSDYLFVSQTFLNVTKTQDKDRVSLKIDDTIFEKEIKLEKNLLGTIALIDNKKDSYSFAKVIVEKKG